MGSFSMSNSNKATTKCQNNFPENEKLLTDIKASSGKKRPWTEKKIGNVAYADLLALSYYKKATRVSTCADVLRFAVTDTGHLKLKQTWFCKSRLCPMCAWRRSMKHGVMTNKIVDEAQKRYPSGRWLFLTLTTRNTTNANDLRAEVSEYSKAFKRLLGYSRVKDNVLGFVRGIEVTVNQDDHSYNQHMHALLLVKSTYFKNKKHYVKQDDWVELWQKAMRLDYKPSVHVSAVKKGDENEKTKAVLEVAKYAVKSFDYLGKSDGSDFDLEKHKAVLDDLENALERKRLTAFGGVLKEIQRELNLEDTESDKTDLVNVGDDDDEQETEQMITAKWDSYQQNYIIKK